ncbi:hypothetical protein BU15DRAFT_66787 [Melanogaster broomeanus]|nr:hypothetical protein BU15DRAFT_66787 [Melanogaster broomeanus]
MASKPTLSSLAMLAFSQEQTYSSSSSAKQAWLGMGPAEGGCSKKLFEGVKGERSSFSSSIYAPERKSSAVNTSSATPISLKCATTPRDGGGEMWTTDDTDDTKPQGGTPDVSASGNGPQPPKTQYFSVPPQSTHPLYHERCPAQAERSLRLPVAQESSVTAQRDTTVQCQIVTQLPDLNVRSEEKQKARSFWMSVTRASKSVSAALSRGGSKARKWKDLYFILNKSHPSSHLVPEGGCTVSAIQRSDLLAAAPAPARLLKAHKAITALSSDAAAQGATIDRYRTDGMSPADTRTAEYVRKHPVTPPHRRATNCSRWNPHQIWPAEVDWWKTRFKLETRQERKRLAVVPAKQRNITSLTNESQIRRHSLRSLDNAIDGSDIVILVMDIRDPEGCRTLQEVTRRRAGEQLKFVFVHNLDLTPRENVRALWVPPDGGCEEWSSAEGVTPDVSASGNERAAEASAVSHIPVQGFAMQDDTAAQAPAVMVGDGRRSLEELKKHPASQNFLISRFAMQRSRGFVLPASPYETTAEQIRRDYVSSLHTVIGHSNRVILSVVLVLDGCDADVEFPPRLRERMPSVSHPETQRGNHCFSTCLPSEGPQGYHNRERAQKGVEVNYQPGTTRRAATTLRKNVGQHAGAHELENMVMPGI